MKYVIALGGNAINLENLNSFAKSLKKISKGNHFLITHGNGPQVGELAAVEHKNLGVLTAQTQAEIGLSIIGALEKNGLKASLVITRVDADKKSLDDIPTKPIGKFYSSMEGLKMMAQGHVMKQFEPGYRRVVLSPRPVKILEEDTINELSAKGIVVCCGGGGVPVFEGRPVDGVVDKDLASSLLACSNKADALVILTNVEGAYIDFGKVTQKKLEKIGMSELKKYVAKGHFESGSMGPKIEAGIQFVSKTKKPAYIGKLESFEQVIQGKECTTIVP